MSKRGAKHVPPTGELRQSQLLTTFGPGSMVDLPNQAVLIGGLDHWQFAERKRIYEDRLERRLRDRPGRADSVRPSLCEGAHQRHRLVRVRPRDLHT